WEQGIPTENAHYYTDFLYQQKTTLLDYLPENSLLFVDDYSRMMETEREIAREEAEWQTLKIEEMRVFS
ncbi:hypothetical protein, partial [Paraclostridium sordellii]